MGLDTGRASVETANIIRQNTVFITQVKWSEVFVAYICIHFRNVEGYLTVHLPHEIMWNASLIQQGNFIDVFLARHVSGTYAHHQEHYMLSCSIRFSAPSFWMGLEIRCVGRVYGADCAVRLDQYINKITLLHQVGI
jgi:hypothetical protein